MRSKILLLGLTAFLLTACGSAQIESMTIKATNNSLPAEVREFSQAIITPDYSKETLDVSYSSAFPLNERAGKFRNRIVFEDKDLFQKFTDVDSLVKGAVESTGGDCVGGVSYTVEIEESTKQFVEKNIYVCGENDTNQLLADFYTAVQAKLKAEEK